MEEVDPMLKFALQALDQVKGLRLSKEVTKKGANQLPYAVVMETTC